MILCKKFIVHNPHGIKGKEVYGLDFALNLLHLYTLTNSMAYGTQRFNATFIRAFQ
jgi:hypothetical protein